MSKPQTFLVIDTETTMNDTIADFGAVVVNRNGKTLDSCATLGFDHFTQLPLFHVTAALPLDLWSKATTRRTKPAYDYHARQKRQLRVCAYGHKSPRRTRTARLKSSHATTCGTPPPARLAQ